MSRHEEEDTIFQQALFTNQWQTSATTIVILLVAYYGWPYLAYNTTIKRRLYDTGTAIVPVRFIKGFYKITQQKLGLSAIQPEPGTEADANDSSGIGLVVQKARRLSGLTKVVSEATYSGLGNWDNSCFQNSVLQGLASLHSFRRFAEKCWYMSEVMGLKAPTDAALKDFLAQLLGEVDGRVTLWPPEVLRSMDTWQQQDAQEYFSKIVEATEKEATAYQSALQRHFEPGLSDLTSVREEINVAEIIKDRVTKNLERLHASVPANPLEGLLAQSLRCQTCGYSEGVSCMSFNCLTLNMGFGSSCSLEGLIDAYTQSELIEGVECDECTRKAAPATDEQKTDDTKVTKKQKVLSTKAKQILFGRLPHNLVFHVNRSVYDNWGNQQKNNAYVGFPAILNIEHEWMDGTFAEARKIEASYELRCIITHQGRHDNGHYVACGRRGKHWYSFNDEVVTRLSEEQVLGGGNVFMLFYELIERQAIVEVPETEVNNEVLEEDILKNGATSSPPSDSSEASAKLAPAAPA